MSAEEVCLNTDREIYREVEGDYYSPSISVTQSGAIQFNVGGLVIGKTIAEWHDLISKCQSCGGSMFYGPEAKENHAGDCQAPTYTPAEAQEMKNAWVDEVAGRVEKLQKYAEYGGWDEGGVTPYETGDEDKPNPFSSISTDTLYLSRPEVLATIKEMKE